MIYVDILIFLNAVIDYFLILLASKISSVIISEKRLILSCVFASLTSLYIFVPALPKLLDLIIRIAICFFITFVAFGFKSTVSFIKAFTSFIAVTFVYNGFAVVFWNIFKPYSMVIKNSVVYFDISAVEMIIFSCIGYLLIRLGRFLICRFSPHCKRVDLDIYNNNSAVNIKAIVDSGNSLKDIYGGRKVVITDKKTAGKIFGDLNSKPPLLLPFESIGGSSMVNAYYCEAVGVNGRRINKVLIAVSENVFEGDYKAIVSNDILEE